MDKELGLWHFVSAKLTAGEGVVLLVVATSSGSSPGRAGYKMAVAADGELSGSIGGGVMEVRLVELARGKIVGLGNNGGAETVDQVHRKGVPSSSGMICSGRQTVIFKQLGPRDSEVVRSIVLALTERRPDLLCISPEGFYVEPAEDPTIPGGIVFEKISETNFAYRERLGPKNLLYIVGGGHCSLALSEMMSKMDFRVHIFDDRPELNTIEKNRFADRITIIDRYDEIADYIPSAPNAYVVVMTLGYTSDEVVIRQLFDRQYRYFGVLGSKAKMATLIRSLRDDGLDIERIDRIHTPVGLPINSHTPEEIAVSIAAEIIAEKNRDDG